MLVVIVSDHAAALLPQVHRQPRRCSPPALTGAPQKWSPPCVFDMEYVQYLSPDPDTFLLPV